MVTAQITAAEQADNIILADVLKNFNQYRKGTVGEASEGGGSTWNL